MNKIAVIPARAGSKGLKNKNILPIKGKPMLAWTIEAAVNSKCFDHVIVSTDSNEYAQISKKYGAEVLIRGKNLSNDTASSYDVIKDLIERCSFNYDYFVLLQPTSPLRTENDIINAISLFESKYENYDYLVSVVESEYPANLIKPIYEGNMKAFDMDYSNYHRQDYKEYAPNGAIFIAKPFEYLKQKHFYGSKSLAYIMEKISSIDIDTNYDYDIACFFANKI